MELIFDETGGVACIHNDDFRALYEALGVVHVRRASHVEPSDDASTWTADMRPVGGPVLGPFATRADALAAEVRWLQTQLEQRVTARWVLTTT